MAIKTLSIAILYDPFIKKWLLMRTHWELKWNMLATNGKIKNNHSLLGMKIDAIS
jgi:hypothetical protein